MREKQLEPILAEGCVATSHNAASKSNKVGKARKRFAVLDARSLYIYTDESKRELEDTLLLVFCFVRSGKALRSRRHKQTVLITG